MLLPSILHQLKKRFKALIECYSPNCADILEGMDIIISIDTFLRLPFVCDFVNASIIIAHPCQLMITLRSEQLFAKLNLFIEFTKPAMENHSEWAGWVPIHGSASQRNGKGMEMCDLSFKLIVYADFINGKTISFWFLLMIAEMFMVFCVRINFHWKPFVGLWDQVHGSLTNIQIYLVELHKCIQSNPVIYSPKCEPTTITCDWFIVCILQTVISQPFNMCERATYSAKKKKRKKNEMNIKSGIKITMDANVHGETNKF